MLSLLQGALNVDQWETVQHQPELFARGGRIYEQIEAKIGTLKDDMHCNIKGLPGKVREAAAGDCSVGDGINGGGGMMVVVV